jgi:hypothetical protein
MMGREIEMDAGDLLITLVRSLLFSLHRNALIMYRPKDVTFTPLGLVVVAGTRLFFPVRWRGT